MIHADLEYTNVNFKYEYFANQYLGVVAVGAFKSPLKKSYKRESMHACKGMLAVATPNLDIPDPAALFKKWPNEKNPTCLMLIAISQCALTFLTLYLWLAGTINKL